MSAIKLSTPSSGSISLSPANTASNLTITVPAVSGTMATSTTPTFTTTIGVGGATAAASGAGITFPATQSASSDANTLDDYEEGSWTPVFAGSGSNPTVTYTKQEGTYVKVGKNVLIICDVRWSSLSGGSGNLNINGLPFTSSSGYATGVVGEKSGANLGLSGNILVMENNLNAASVVFLETKQSSSSSGYQVTSLSGSGYLIFSFAYISAS